MAVHVRKHDGPLEPIVWPTGEEVAVKRPNIYAAKFWAATVTPTLEKGDRDQGAALDALVEFVSMICPSKSREQIMEECDEAFLMLVCGYSRDALETAQAFVAEVLGKSVAGTADPASPPPTTSGTSPAELPAPTAVPCGA